MATVSTLFRELEATTTEIDLSQFFKDAVNYGEYHFQTEETFFSRFDYPEKNLHLSLHQAYKKNLNSLLLKEGDSHLRSRELLTFLEDWWIEHITGIDQTLGKLPESVQKETAQTRYLRPTLLTIGKILCRPEKPPESALG